MTNPFPADLALRWREESTQDLPPDQPMSNDLVVAHIDVDGMVAAAGLLRTLPDDTALRFSSYRLLADYLGRLTESEWVPRRLWVADLGIARGDLERVVTALDTLRSRGCRVFWFDHHTWQEDVAQAVRERCDAFHVVPGVTKPAALIVADVVQPGPMFGALAREILVQRGATPNPVAASWFRCLACLMVERDWAAIHRAVRRLSRLETLHGDEIERLKRRPSAQEAELVGSQLEVSTTQRGTRYALFDLRKARLRREILRDVCRRQDLDLVITVPSDCEIVVDRMDGPADLMRLGELESLDWVSHVCPHLNPVLIELRGREPSAHTRAVTTVVDWIEEHV